MDTFAFAHRRENERATCIGHDFADLNLLWSLQWLLVLDSLVAQERRWSVPWNSFSLSWVCMVPFNLCRLPCYRHHFHMVLLLGGTVDVDPSAFSTRHHHHHHHHHQQQQQQQHPYMIIILTISSSLPPHPHPHDLAHVNYKTWVAETL